MIELSYENFIIMVFVGPLFLAILGASIYVAYINTKGIIKRLSHNKIFKVKMAEVERQKKEEGLVHKWVNIAVGAKEYYVCELTGFCPTLHGFFSVEYIKDIVKAREIEKEYQEYRKSEIARIGEEIGLGYEAMNDYADKLIGIKTKYYVDKLEQLKTELSSKSE
jgi:hypothetical protein